MRSVSIGQLEYRRRADGAVEVWRPALPSECIPSYDGPQLRRASVIPANEWASIVSALSTGGEDAFSYNIALSFHTGGTAYDPDAAQYDAAPIAEMAVVAE